MGFIDKVMVTPTNMNFNLPCAVYAWESLSPEIIQAPFKVTCTSSFQRIFAEKYKKFQEKQKDGVETEGERLERASVASRLPAVRKRHNDEERFKVMTRITESNTMVSTKITKIQILHGESETINSI